MSIRSEDVEAWDTFKGAYQYLTGNHRRLHPKKKVRPDREYVWCCYRHVHNPLASCTPGYPDDECRWVLR